MTLLRSRWANRLRRRGREENGAILVIFAGCLVLFLGLAAMAIDVGSFYQAQRQAQAAADAGALAASQDLPNNTTGAGNDGRTYALQNYPGSTVTVTAPYNGNTNQVKVTVDASTPSFFGRIFNVISENVSATAVAGEHGKATQAAIFAYADGGNCNDMGIQIDKNNAQIGGALQSNGVVTDSGGGNTQVSAAAYGAGCSPGFTGNSGHYTTQPFPAQPTSYPLDYRLTPPTCTQNTNGDLNVTGMYPPGVYCASGTITFSGATGTDVTFVANKINVVSGATLSAPMTNGAYGLLLYQTGCDASAGALTIAGNNETLNGTIFAPCATVDIQKNNVSTGFIEANNVHIEFNNYVIAGDGPVIAGTGSGLTQ